MIYDFEATKRNLMEALHKALLDEIKEAERRLEVQIEDQLKDLLPSLEEQDTITIDYALKMEGGTLCISVTSEIVKGGKNET